MKLDPEDIPVERLNHRYDFLIDRAQAHLSAPESHEPRSPTNWRDQACAATLMRDAGCVALLLGKPKQASKNFLQAGGLLLKLGLPAGAALVLLGDPREGSPTGEAFASLFAHTARRQSRQERLYRDDARALIPDATHEPRQMLGLAQAERIALAFNQPGLFGTNGDDAALLRSRLERRGAHPAGITGLSIEAYLALADQLSTPHPIASEAGVPEVPRSLELLFALRAEGLETARKDRYHWNLMPRPAELVDLDSLILMLIALGQDGGRLIERALPTGAPGLTDTPYRAAELLFLYHRDLPGQ